MAENALNPQHLNPGPYPIPYQLEVKDDEYENPSATPPLRIRTYILKDTNGNFWCCGNPVTITEQFSAFQGSGYIPEAHDWVNGREGDIDSGGNLSDNYQLSPTNQNQVSYWQILGIVIQRTKVLAATNSRIPASDRAPND